MDIELTQENFSKLPIDEQKAILQEYKNLKINMVKTSKEDFIEVISKNADPLIKLITNLSERYIAVKEGQFKFQTNLSRTVFYILGIMIILSGILVGFNKLNGESFTFLLGLISGYLISIIKISMVNKEE